MSSLGDMWDDMWLSAGETDSSKDHGFGFWEFIFGLMKIIGILFGVLILLGIIMIALEYCNIPVFEWLFGVSYMS